MNVIIFMLVFSVTVVIMRNIVLAEHNAPRVMTQRDFYRAMLNIKRAGPTERDVIKRCMGCGERFGGHDRIKKHGRHAS